jgi:anti-sigma B factor antagonist
VSLKINTILDQEDDLWIVDVIGEIDIYTANKLKETLVKILDEHNTSIKINCLELDYIDSTGLGVLIGALKRLKQENKNIIISNAKPNISKLLSITGLNKIFVIQ